MLELLVKIDSENFLEVFVMCSSFKVGVKFIGIDVVGFGGFFEFYCLVFLKDCVSFLFFVLELLIVGIYKVVFGFLIEC